MAKDTFYFSHDYNSRNDIKIKKLIAKHGYLGYGIFWALIEDLYNNANVLPTDCESIAFDLRTHENIIDSVINDFDLFIFNNGTFGSLSIQNRIEERNKKSLKARESANYRWEKQKDNANAMRTQCDSNAIKERKGKEIITDNKLSVKRFTPPTRDDIDQYAKSEMIGSNTSVDKFHDYYTANGWKVGRNAMKDWKAAFRNWIKNEKQYEHGTHQQTSPKYDGVTSSRSRADWEALQEWGKGIDEYREQLFGGIRQPED